MTTALIDVLLLNTVKKRILKHLIDDNNFSCFDDEGILTQDKVPSTVQLFDLF